MIYVKTVSGIKFDLLLPIPQMVAVEDIAWALSGIPRFTRHTRQDWMVDQHTRLVAEIGAEIAGPLHEYVRVERVIAHCWLHDCGETYTNDISAPMKRLMRHHGFDIKRIEEPIDHAIYLAFRMPQPTDFERAIVKHADEIALQIEKATIRDGSGDHPAWRRIDAIRQQRGVDRFARDLCAAVVAAGGMDIGRPGRGAA